MNGFSLEDLKKEIKKLVSKERERGSKKHNEFYFYDMHQAYSVIKEELEETKEVFKAFVNCFENDPLSFWNDIKNDENKLALIDDVDSLDNLIIELIIEAIQVGAMIEKSKITLNIKE